MKIKQMYLTDRQLKILTEKAMQRDISFSELVRRILDEWIENNEKGGSANDWY